MRLQLLDLPLPMQILGAPFTEATVLKAADASQRLIDRHLQVPPAA